MPMFSSILTNPMKRGISITSPGCWVTASRTYVDRRGRTSTSVTEKMSITRHSGSGVGDRSSDHQGGEDLWSERLGGLDVELCPQPVQDAGEEGTGSRREDDVGDLDVGESELAQGIDVVLLD